MFGARQSAEEKGKGEFRLQLMVLESSFCYWLVMWVGRWEASHLSVLISNVGGKVESQPLISNMGGKVESQPRALHVIEKREKEYYRGC